MLHVVFDTTAFTADPRRETAAFRTLSRLAQAGQVQLHIPEIVKREFLSQERPSYKKAARTVFSSMHGLRRLKLPVAAAERLANAMESLNSVREEIENFPLEAFDQWVAETSAIIHPVDPAHGPRVVDGYFVGRLPFSQPKHRQDFPDAFICETIRDLAEQHKSLYLVSSDNRVLNTARSIDGLRPFAQLEDLIASDVMQGLLATHYKTSNLQALWSLLRNQRDLVVSGIEDKLLNELISSTVSSSTIPSDDSEATIAIADAPAETKLHIAKVVDHGDGLFVMPFSLGLHSLLVYPIFKADYYSLPDEKTKQIIVSDLNDHFYDAEEEYELDVEGLASIDLNVDDAVATALQAGDLSGDDLLAILEHATISIDSIGDVKVHEEAHS